MRGLIGEHINLASTKPVLWSQMMARLLAINDTFFAPDRGTKDPAACAQAIKNGGFWVGFHPPLPKPIMEIRHS